MNSTWRDFNEGNAEPQIKRNETFQLKNNDTDLKSYNPATNPGIKFNVELYTNEFTENRQELKKSVETTIEQAENIVKKVATFLKPLSAKYVERKVLGEISKNI